MREGNTTSASVPGRAAIRERVGVIGLGVALFALAVGLELIASLIEHTTRRTSDIQYAYSRRLERDRPAA